MFLIDCPYCGPREETEFSYGHEAHVHRPAGAAAENLSDAEWSQYLFMRNNPKGPHLERWVHTHGCRRWFNVQRNTATNEIMAVYRMGEKLPAKGDGK